jgi:hypothetical protein
MCKLGHDAQPLHYSTCSLPAAAHLRATQSFATPTCQTASACSEALAERKRRGSSRMGADAARWERVALRQARWAAAQLGETRGFVYRRCEHGLVSACAFLFC